MTSKALRLPGPAILILTSVALASSASLSTSPQAPAGPPDLRIASEASTTLDAQALPSQRFGPGPLHKVWLEGSEREAQRARLQASGALVRLHDYGAFALAIVDARAFAGEAQLLAGGYDFRDEQDLMVFNELVLDSRQGERALAALPPDLRVSRPGAPLPADAGLYVVQFEGPVRDEWLASLDASGVGFRQFVPMNAYVVEADPQVVGALGELALATPAIQHVGVYEPAFKLHAELRKAWLAAEGDARKVTIQLVRGARSEAALSEIRRVAEQVYDVQDVGPYVNVQARVLPAFFQPLSFLPAVFQIEPLGERVRHDERQGQIVAGNVTATGPSAPGYLTWLASAGFDATQFGSFSVNVADDALTLTGHPDLPTARVAFTLNPTSQTGAQGGHGFLNANIIAGFNNGTGTALEDTGGYNYGLGIAPFARVGSTAIFGAGSLNPTSYESQAYGLGSRISSNSWGFQTGLGGPVPDYDANSQAYDFIARDAQTGTAGNQQYLVVFSAGNNGSGANTVSTPGTAKNIITVAAGENDRQTGTDGCGISNTGANNWNDIATFSSRGPVAAAAGDGRWKPEICAPGTHIEAGIPQSNYDGSSVCNQFFPAGQTLYGWSSGTSHSCPAVAGGAALVYQWFLNQGLAAPSPAMTKAVLVAGAQYMTGTGANDTLPSNSQGTGEMNLPRSIGAATRILQDQTTILGASGASFSLTANVVDTTKPLRVALVWTDAPGPTSGAPYVNNLDLSVTVGASTYRGNVFSGANSITGGVADIRNNTEVVFLPAGTSGSFTVNVVGTAIGGDGVPGNADTTDQDFALVVYNATAGAPPAPVASFTGTPTTGTEPLLVNFTDSSTGSITSWAWTFGDGGTSTAASTSHIYTTAGTYTVALTVTGPGGSDTLTRTNYITVNTPPPAPVASFTGTPTNGNAPLAVAFTDASTGSIASWAWTFGDGGTSTLQSPSHTYTAAGTYDVALTVTGPGGSDTQTRTAYVTVGAPPPPPVASFTGAPTSGTAPLAVVFTDASTGSITSWAWTFGDGGTSTLQSPSHTYNTAGVFTVALTVTGPGGNDTQTRTSYVTVTNAGGGTLYYLSFSANTAVPGVGTVADEDIVSYDPATNTWALYFDGSDVGLSGTDVSNLHVRTDGSILMSFDSATFSVPGLTGGPSGTTVENHDIVLFTPTSTGANTAGSFSFYFDGSDVGLTTTAESLDGLFEFPDGTLALSTTGNPGVTGLTGLADEDILRFAGTFGAATSGTWSLYFDGSDVGLSTNNNEDLDAIAYASPTDTLFSTVGAYSGGGGSGDGTDVSSFRGTYGSTTSGTASLLLDLSALGIATSANVDGVSQLP